MTSIPFFQSQLCLPQSYTELILGSASGIIQTQNYKCIFVCVFIVKVHVSVDVCTSKCGYWYRHRNIGMCYHINTISSLYPGVQPTRSQKMFKIIPSVVSTIFVLPYSLSNRLLMNDSITFKLYEVLSIIWRWSKVHRRTVKVKCKYYITVYHGFKHAYLLVFTESPPPKEHTVGTTYYILSSKRMGRYKCANA